MKTLELSLKKPKNGAVTHKENRKQLFGGV